MQRVHDSETVLADVDFDRPFIELFTLDAQDTSEEINCVGFSLDLDDDGGGVWSVVIKPCDTGLAMPREASGNGIGLVANEIDVGADRGGDLLQAVVDRPGVQGLPPDKDCIFGSR